jgi:single-strand DNA-binding protein
MLFTGRLTADAEVRTVKGDRKLTSFTVALNQRYKTRSGEKKEKTAFVDCAYWVNPGLADYLTKGAVVEIAGWMEAQAYQSTKHGLQGRLHCTCDTIKLFSASVKPQEKPDKTVASSATEGKGGEDDDLPF